MSDLTEVLAVAESAVTTQFADAETVGIEACDDGSYNVTLNVTPPIKGTMCNESDNAQAGGSDDTPDEDGDAREDGDAANPPEGDDEGENGQESGSSGTNTDDDTPEDTPMHEDIDTPGPLRSVSGRGVETADMEHNELTALAGEINSRSDTWSYPEDTTSEGILEALGNAKISTARIAARRVGLDEHVVGPTEESDEKDTPASGGVEKVEKDERTIWIVNGVEKTYNDLQGEVSDMDTPYPDDTSGDNLAQMVLNAGETAQQAETDDDDDDDDDTPATDDTEFGGEMPLSPEVIRKYGDDGVDVEKVQTYQTRNGLCKVEGCVYGANKNADKCADCQTDDSPSGSNDGQSIADEVTEVAEIFGCTNTEARQAIEAVNKGHFETTKKALDTL